ncbi:unnamed protein product, partial [Rotaria magnacalcarata]
MPRKARINEESFEKALCEIGIDDVALLNSSKSSADIWGRICSRMGKGDNIENRRACYDFWKRKGYSLHSTIPDFMQDVKQLNDNGTDPTNIVDFDQLRETEVDTRSDYTRPTTLNSNVHSLVGADREMKEISCSPSSEIKGKKKDFMKQLSELLQQHQTNFSLIYTHDYNSTVCSGEMVAIQVLCQCIESYDTTCIRKKNFLNNHASNEIQGQSSNSEKSEGDYLHNLLTGQATIDSRDLQTEETAIVNNISHDKSTPISIVQTPPLLFVSPTSSLLSSATPKIMNVDSTCKTTSKLNVAACLLNQAKNILSPSKVPDHTIISDEQKNVLRYLNRQNANSSDFIFDVKEIQQIERNKANIISQSDMDKLKKLQQDQHKKQHQKNQQNKIITAVAADDDDNNYNIENPKRNLEWTLILDEYVWHSNDYCVFSYDRHHFTTRTTIGMTNQFFMSVDVHCKFSTCTCIFHATLTENGRLRINYLGRIVHKAGEVHARPIRGSRREELQQFTSLGATPGALYLQQLKSISTANKEAGNRNAVGSSRSVLRKISSEANSKLRRDDDLDKSLRELKIEQAKKVFPGEVIPGYLQEISTDPLRLICFTAGGIAAYHHFGSTMPLSWDATGGIIVNRNKRIFYYELTMTSLSKGGSSLPISVMLSASHGTMDIVHWMNCFIEKYKQVYGFSNPFPKPPVIHSDRASVFLLAGIQIFNQDETMDRYIERCWRILQRTATKRDLEITIVHACLGHFMKNVRKNASKDLGKKQIPFGMWLMALLVNCNTLDEMIIIWRNICIVLMSPSQNDQFKMSLSVLSKLADEMNGDPEKKNFVLQNVSVTAKGHITNAIKIDKDDNITHDIGSEEESIFYVQSSFKELFTTIKQQCKDLLNVYDGPEWKDLPNNPLFSVSYLNRILKLYMPTTPIWSNLLLGNFGQRYGYSLNSTVPPCSCHFGRTTGASESQMRVLKEAILSKKIYSRIDEVASKLGETIEAVEMQFADYILIKKGKSRLLPAKKQKLAEEPWNKRNKTGKTTGVYTSKKPPMNLVAMMNNKLLGQNDDANLDAGQLTQFLKFENTSNNCWLNSVLQMILASGHIVEAIRRFGSVEADLASSRVMVLGNMLNCLVNKNESVNEVRKTTVEQSFIRDHIGYLRWAGIKIRPGKNNYVFDFFQSAILPTLLHYNIDLQYVIDISIECSSCKSVSSVTRQNWNYLLVHQTTKEDTLDNIVADLFGPTLTMNICPKCVKQGQYDSSLSIMNCPKDLFIRFEPNVAMGQHRPKLTTHVDFAQIISRNVARTRSYSRYTLQSFIVFHGEDDDGHYMTFAQHKGDWYRLNDMNITIVRASTVFDDQLKNEPVMLAHFTRPSEIDIFSIALWNIFTNFAPTTTTLPSNLSLNDAANYFAKHHIIEDNPLNLVTIKLFYCSICKRETYAVDRFHDVWQMQTNIEEVNAIINSFVYEEIKCSKCKEQGLTRVVLYDIPRFLILKTRSTDPNTINFIDDSGLLHIRLSFSHPSFEYNMETVLIVLEENAIFYLRKTENGYSSYNKATSEFEPIQEFSTCQTGLASNWIVFVYKTETTIFDTPTLNKTLIDQNNLTVTTQPEPWTIETVQGLLAAFKEYFHVGPIQIKSNDMKILLDSGGDINDLIIDAHLSITATQSTSNQRVLALASHTVSEILEKRLKELKHIWLDYDIVLCPINQKQH